AVAFLTHSATDESDERAVSRLDLVGRLELDDALVDAHLSRQHLPGKETLGVAPGKALHEGPAGGGGGQPFRERDLGASMMSVPPSSIVSSGSGGRDLDHEHDGAQD